MQNNIVRRNEIYGVNFDIQKVLVFLQALITLLSAESYLSVCSKPRVSLAGSLLIALINPGFI